MLRAALDGRAHVHQHHGRPPWVTIQDGVTTLNRDDLAHLIVHGYAEIDTTTTIDQHVHPLRLTPKGRQHLRARWETTP